MMQSEPFEPRDLEIPPGFGPILEISRGVEPSKRSRRWIDNWPTLLIIAVLMLWRVWPHWELALPFIAIGYVFVVVASGGSVRAGEGWLASGKTFVHTDRLSYLKWGYAGLRAHFVMKDTDGHRVCISVPELSRNLKLWKLFYDGVNASYDAGLKTNKRTAAIFGRSAEGAVLVKAGVASS
jgi:hypothetical protein